MEIKQLVIPRLGESIVSVQLLRYLKQPGDFVREDEIIAEVSSDKVDSEIPASSAGRILEFRFKEGDNIPVGEVYAVLEISGGEPAPGTAPYSGPAAQSAKLSGRAQSREKLTGTEGSQIRETKDSGAFLSPLVSRIVQEESLTTEDLEKITPSGKEGRISKNDVLNYLKNKSQKQSSHSFSGPGDLIEMDNMRQIIARRMKQSKQTSPHVTAFVEADVTDLVKWREQHKDTFYQKYGQKLTVTPLIVQAVVRAIQDFPMINVSVDETETKVFRHHDINIGIATGLPNGNLIVPVIKKAALYNLEGLARQTNQLVERARNGKLSPDDVSGGTFTISNVGTFGNLMGTPIINQPEVAILATGVIKKKPAVMETPTGDVFAVRQFMFLSLSFDHRVVDGSLGGVFLKRVSDYLENWDVKTTV